jgi:hypothetical protein
MRSSKHGGVFHPAFLTAFWVIYLVNEYSPVNRSASLELSAPRFL